MPQAKTVRVRKGKKVLSYSSVREAVEALGGEYANPEKVGVKDLAALALRNGKVTSVTIDGTTYYK